MRRNCARCSELPQMLQLSESDNLACKGSTMGEHMLTQLLTKEEIDVQLEKLDRKIKELETNDILDISDESKRIDEPPRIQPDEVETSDILDITDEPKRIHEPPSIQPNELETSDILDIIDEPKRTQEPPRIYEKPHLENSRLYQAGEFIVSAIAIILIIFAVIFTALISATFWEIIQQFGFRQYVSVATLAGTLFGWGYFLGYARRE
jgi:hypothetical protein